MVSYPETSIATFPLMLKLFCFTTLSNLKIFNFHLFNFSVLHHKPQKMSHTPNNPDPPELNDGLLKLLKPEDLLLSSVPWEDSKRDRPVDILLLTAKECEFLSCVSHLNPGFYKSWLNGLGYVYFGRIGGENESLKIAVVECKVGSVEPQASLVVVTSGVEALRPKAVINVGYCGRLDNKVGLGDVIISSKLKTYSTGKQSKGVFEDRNISVTLSPAFAQLVQTANYGWQRPLKDPGKLNVKVFKDGVLLSGPLVVDDEELRTELLKRGSDAIAVEMEGQGGSFVIFCYCSSYGLLSITTRALSA